MSFPIMGETVTGEGIEGIFQRFQWERIPLKGKIYLLHTVKKSFKSINENPKNVGSLY